MERYSTTSLGGKWNSPLLVLAGTDDHRNSMEMRLQRRLEIDEPVHVTVLDASDASFLGRITNYSGNGLGLATQGTAPVGAALKVELKDTLLLGEVCYCRLGRGGFRDRPGDRARAVSYRRISAAGEAYSGWIRRAAAGAAENRKRKIGYPCRSMSKKGAVVLVARAS